jgi:hypothetical protein
VSWYLRDVPSGWKDIPLSEMVPNLGFCLMSEYAWKPPESVKIIPLHPAILCIPPRACIVEEPGCCIKWNVFITIELIPIERKSAESTDRTTPKVASGRKTGRGKLLIGFIEDKL